MPRTVSCRATPSTVYGSEPVTFELEASPGGWLDVEIADGSGARLGRERVSAPGTWRPPALPSGDFSLQITPEHASCAVTVNRELSRASEVVR